MKYKQKVVAEVDDLDGNVGRWYDKFYIPDGEKETLSELREKDPEYEAKFWGTAMEDFAKWYKKNKLKK